MTGAPVVAAPGPAHGLARPVTGAAPYVVTEACTACGACLLTCPEHAIMVGIPLTVRADRCTSCGECVEICPVDAFLELGPLR